VRPGPDEEQGDEGHDERRGIDEQGEADARAARRGLVAAHDGDDQAGQRRADEQRSLRGRLDDAVIRQRKRRVHYLKTPVEDQRIHTVGQNGSGIGHR